MALGIQKKLAITCSSFLIVAFALIVAGTLSFAVRVSRENIQKQQFATTELIARSLDDKLGGILVEISRIGQVVPPEALDDPRLAQRFLTGQHSRFTGFDGLYLVNNGFRLMGGVPFEPGQQGKQVGKLIHFLTGVREFGLPDFSEPYTSPTTKGPAIAVAYPVEDRHGTPKGFLLGRINLNKDNFVEDLISYKIGDRGYIYVINRERRLILHPDKTRLMQQDIPPGSNRFLERALLGYQGSGETVNSRGVHQIISAKRLKTVDWILTTVFPEDEAYLALKDMRTFLISSFLLVTTLSVILIWRLTVRMTANLDSFTTQIREIKKDVMHPRQIVISGNDEVGLLADTFNDLVDELGRARESLVEMTRTDPLTGLHNRRHFTQQAPVLIALSEREGAASTFLMIDLDHFKRINDSYGHDVGDQVLVQVAGVLRRAVRPYDLVTRHGGEEFLLLFPKTGHLEAQEIAERLRQQVAALQIPCRHDTFSVTVSIGGYVAQKTGDIEEAVALADRALYQAKNEGRNRTSFIRQGSA